jgi:protein-disulfide isomerase
MTDQNEPLKLPTAPEPDPRREDVVTISQSTIYYFVIGVVFFIAGFIVAWVTFSATSGGANAQEVRVAAAAGAREAVQTEVGQLQSTTVASVVQAVGAGGAPRATALPPTPAAIEVADSPGWGPEDASVTIVEYSDFECPYCSRYFRETYPLLKQQYGDKVRYVFKHFPLTNIHPNAERAGLASECAREQGKFWEFHDVAFANQTSLSREGLIRLAAQAGVPNAEQFTQCLDTAKYASVIQADFNEGIGLNITGTPTFFINGLPLVGAQPFQTFKATIDRALAFAASN